MKYPTRVTVDITSNGYKISVFHEEEKIDEQEMKRSRVGFSGNSPRNMDENFPEFAEDVFLGSFDPANVCNHLDDFAIGNHPDLEKPGVEK